MTARPHHILILGAGAAGAAAARTLTSREDVRVTLVVQTGETPYIRMLIKDVAFGPASPETAGLRLPDIEVIADTAEEIDPVAKTVELASGVRIGYDALIIATGSRPRGLPESVLGVESAIESGKVTALHSMEDALHIRELLARSDRPSSVAIYGGGIIAAETASSLNADGHNVTLIARSAIPGAAVFGEYIAEHLADEHSSHVRTRFGSTVQDIETTTEGIIVQLDDGTPIAADLLILGLGTIPYAPVPWVDGVDVDAQLRTDSPNVYVAGGAALHHDDVLGTWRIDHWEDAAAQGVHAARTALHDLGLDGRPGAYLPRSPHVLMVYGLTISGIGYAGGDSDSYLEERGELVARHEKGGAVIGVTGVNAATTVYQWRSRLHTVLT